MEEKKLTGNEILEGYDLSPRHDSWARITTRSTLIGFVILLVLSVLFIIVIELHFNRIGFAILGVTSALILLGWTLSQTRALKKGRLGDARRSARIKADLFTRLGVSNVHVEISKGVVTLRGTVPYPNFREAAEQLALQAGAKRVVNALEAERVTPEPPAALGADFPGVTTPEGAPMVSGISLEQAVREALEADERVRADLVIVRVDDGIAYLTGRQEGVQASDAVMEVTLHVPGILGVSNDIEIMPSY